MHSRSCALNLIRLGGLFKRELELDNELKNL